MSQLVNSLELLKSLSDATTALVQKLAKSVVSVNARMSRGTGVVLDKQGYIVTCNHVLQGCNTVRVGQGEKTFDALVVGTDAYNDMALLKTEQGNFEPIELGNSDNLNTGQFALALANPFNRKQPTATTGIITNPDSTIRGFRGTAMENVIATDAKLNPGFSGGPLVDAEGKLIGINTAYVWSRGIAIPVNKVKTITDRLLTGGKIRKAYLGLVANTVMIPPEIQAEAGIDQETGVMVFQVELGAPAKKAGLTMGDVIVAFNGKPVTDFYDLPRLLSEDVAGKKTTLTIIREENSWNSTSLRPRGKAKTMISHFVPPTLMEPEPLQPLRKPGPLSHFPNPTPHISINTAASAVSSSSLFLNETGTSQEATASFFEKKLA